MCIRDRYNSIGNCFSEIKDYKSAEIYYNKAISIIPDNFVSYKNLGLNFLDSKNYKEAHKYFSKSLRLKHGIPYNCLLYTSPSPRDRTRSRMPSSA